MSKTIKKSLEAFMIKVVATTVCLCYVFSPMDKEVCAFLHEISHQLEVPEQLLSHTNAIEAGDLHKYSEHILVASEHIHNHNLLDILETIIGASHKKNKSKDSKHLIKKIDKHTRYQEKYKIPICFFPLKQHKTKYFIIGQPLIGHLKKPFQPPRQV